MTAVHGSCFFSELAQAWTKKPKNNKGDHSDEDRENDHDDLLPGRPVACRPEPWLELEEHEEHDADAGAGDHERPDPFPVVMARSIPALECQ